MRKEIHNLNLQHLSFQRNAFLTISFLLTVCVVVLTIMLSMKEEKIVFIPHSLSEKAWVKGNKVSESFLKQQSLVVSMLFLSKTPSSSLEQAKSLLEITAPSLYGDLKIRLNEEIHLLRDQGASYVFVPSNILVNESSMFVDVIGERSTYISGKLINTNKEKYRYKFSFNGQKLLLSGIQREDL